MVMWPRCGARAPALFDILQREEQRLEDHARSGRTARPRPASRTGGAGHPEGKPGRTCRAALSAKARNAKAEARPTRPTCPPLRLVQMRRHRTRVR